jgi:hypothetical protein
VGKFTEKFASQHLLVFFEVFFNNVEFYMGFGVLFLDSLLFCGSEIIPFLVMKVEK